MRWISSLSNAVSAFVLFYFDEVGKRDRTDNLMN